MLKSVNLKKRAACFFLVSWSWVRLTHGRTVPSSFLTLLAVRTYRSNSRREPAKWAVQLYEKFYEADRYKVMRDQLDCASETDDIRDIVEKQAAAFTDYLNFFELVAVLEDNKQLSRDDVLDFFDYYLQCLKRHGPVMEYINTPANGFQHLRNLLGTLQA